MTTERPTPADKYGYVVVTEGAQHHVALRRVAEPDWLQIIATFRNADRAASYREIEDMLHEDGCDDRIGLEETSTPVPAAKHTPGALGELLRIVQTRVTETRSVEMRPADRPVAGLLEQGVVDGVALSRQVEELTAALDETRGTNERLAREIAEARDRAEQHDREAIAAPPAPAPVVEPLAVVADAAIEAATEPETAHPDQPRAPAPSSPTQAMVERILSALPALMGEFPKGPTAVVLCERLGAPRYHVDSALRNLGPTATTIIRSDTGAKHVIPAQYEPPAEELSANQAAVYAALRCGLDQRGSISLNREKMAAIAAAAKIPVGSMSAALDGLLNKDRLAIISAGLGGKTYRLFDENGDVVAPIAAISLSAPSDHEQNTEVDGEQPVDDIPEEPAPSPAPIPEASPPATSTAAWREPPKGRSEQPLRVGDEADKIIVDFGAGQVRRNGLVSFVAGRPLAIVAEISRRAPKPVPHGDIVEEVFPEHKRLNAGPMVNAQVHVANDRLRAIGVHIRDTSKGYVLEAIGPK